MSYFGIGGDEKFFKYKEVRRAITKFSGTFFAELFVYNIGFAALKYTSFSTPNLENAILLSSSNVGKCYRQQNCESGLRSIRKVYGKEIKFVKDNFHTKKSKCIISECLAKIPGFMSNTINHYK